jgi:hypothetical protein
LNGREWNVWPKLAGLVVFAVALWAQSDALVGVFYDDGIYVVGAKALAEGHGYRNIHLPDPLPIVHYPFLYPAALGLLWRLWPSFPQNTALFELFDAAALGAAAWIVAWHARRLELSARIAFAAVTVALSAFPILTIVGVRFTEPLFLALGAWAIALADRDAPTPRAAAFAGVLAGLATLTRSIGLAVVVGVVFAYVVRGAWRDAGIAAGVAAAVLAPWALWVVLHGSVADPALAPNYGTYIYEARQAGIGAMLQGLDLRALGALGRLALPRLPGSLWYGAGALLLAVVSVGAVVGFSRAPTLVASLVSYVIVASLWPFRPDRFMWITVPWFALLLARGCQELWRRGRTPRVAVILVAGLVASGFGRWQVTSLARRGFETTAEGISQSFRILIGAVSGETPGDAVIAVEDEALIYLYTGRRTVPSYLFRWRGRGTEPLGADSALAFYCRAGVTHVALTGPAAQTAPPVAGLLSRGDSTLVPLFQVTGGAALYRLRCPG